MPRETCHQGHRIFFHHKNKLRSLSSACIFIHLLRLRGGRVDTCRLSVKGRTWSRCQPDARALQSKACTPSSLCHRPRCLWRSQQQQQNSIKATLSFQLQPSVFMENPTSSTPLDCLSTQPPQQKHPSLSGFQRSDCYVMIMLVAWRLNGDHRLNLSDLNSDSLSSILRGIVCDSVGPLWIQWDCCSCTTKVSRPLL